MKDVLGSLGVWFKEGHCYKKVEPINPPYVIKLSDSSNGKEEFTVASEPEKLGDLQATTKDYSVSSDRHAHIKDFGFTNLGILFDCEEETVFMDYMPKINVPISLGNYFEWTNQMT